MLSNRFPYKNRSRRQPLIICQGIIDKTAPIVIMRGVKDKIKRYHLTTVFCRLLFSSSHISLRHFVI